KHVRHMSHNAQQHLIFFFKQKTAYEIGLGIPAEPLFRSNHEININIIARRTGKDCVTIDVLPRTPGNNVYVGFMVWSNFTATKCRGLVRSEERRVGKEWGSRWVFGQIASGVRRSQFDAFK